MSGLKRRQFLSVFGLGVGGFLAGCGITGSEPDFTVIIERSALFNPASLIIPLGSMVAWHNRAEYVHTVTADPALAQLPQRVVLPSGVAPFNSGDLFSGDRWSYRFDTPGTYVYFCRYHEVEEMFGSISVIA